MGELRFAHLQFALVERLVTEAFVNRTLTQACGSCSRYWIPAVDDDTERALLFKLKAEAQTAHQSIPMPTTPI
jgi:Opioid growth factor receptor (OGFr) conserved region